MRAVSPSQQLFELEADRLERVLGLHATIRAAKVAHQDNSLGSVVKGVLDGRQGSHNSTKARQHQDNLTSGFVLTAGCW